MSPVTPVSQLERQFRNLARVRRHIWSLLPLRTARTVVEPGCGTGLMARELLTLTDASITCIDKVRRPGVPPGVRFIHGDALHHILPANIYASSFFLYQLRDPAEYLGKVRKALAEPGFYAVAGEPDYSGGHPLITALRKSLSSEGYDPCFGAVMDRAFRSAGFRIVEAGFLGSLPEVPDPEFLKVQLGSHAGWRDEPVSIRVAWGVYAG